MEQHSYSHEVMGCTPATPRSLRVRMAWISRGRRSSTPSTTAGASAIPSASTATTRSAPVPAATAPALAAAALACVGAASGAAADCLAEGAPAMWHWGGGEGRRQGVTEKSRGVQAHSPAYLHTPGHRARTPTLPAAAAVEAGATALGALAPSASPGSPPASCMVEAMACSSRYRCMSCRSTCRMLSRTEGRAAKGGGRPRTGEWVYVNVNELR